MKAKEITPREVSILALFKQRLYNPTKEDILVVENDLKEMGVSIEVERILKLMLKEAQNKINKKIE
ncbi:MAG: hypothetical protein COU51_03540 [Parcubacteria group bacterium CG10_big_fil_rev_8_21_14_0_10_36_14]|nr:MAG: hypothetical protein COU51_03540 [Parcubacteria group bacterium CG10_big_fil_rev_8_21_14_0_10_36_14]